MKSVKVACPHCHAENKLTIFQSGTASAFSARCGICGKEFSIDSSGNIISPKKTKELDKENGVMAILEEIKKIEETQKRSERSSNEKVNSEQKEILPIIPIEPTTYHRLSTIPSHAVGYQKIPFLKDPRAAGKLLIISAILGVSTAIIFFLAISFMFNGELGSVTLDGKVTNEEGEGIPNARLNVTDLNITTTTNSEGHYILRGVTTGTHTVVITAPGYKTAYYRITVLGENSFGENTQEDFVLHRISQNNSSEEYIDRPYGPESYYFLPTMMIITSVVTFLGGIAAIKRKHYLFTLLASVLAVFNLGMIIVSLVLGITSLYILIRSKDGFHTKKPHR